MVSLVLCDPDLFSVQHSNVFDVHGGHCYILHCLPSGEVGPVPAVILDPSYLSIWWRSFSLEGGGFYMMTPAEVPIF